MEDKAIIAAMDITCAKINLFFHQHLILRLGILILFLLVPKFNLAEGWKQMRPNNAVSGKLYLQWWGWYSSNPVVTNDYRIKIHIKSLTEKIYYGFHWTSGPGVPILHSRLLDPLGNLVQYSTIQPNNGSPGFIFDYNQAAAGPNVIDPAGYNALVYTPLMTGDYMFDLDQPLLNMPFDFDFTVIDTTNTPLVETEGRVWCKFWDVQANIAMQPGYMATMYVLPMDSIVTSINFNGLKAAGALIVLNRNGVFPPPTNWIISRQSLASLPGFQHSYLEHKIFVNDPDSTVYPTGILGVIDTNSLTVTPGCNGTVGISFSTSKPGWVEVQIQIDPDPGIQPVDVVISDSVTSGINTFTWDGLNGLGQPVQNGTPFYIGVKFLNGLTNLPIGQTFQNPLGFVVQLKRPAGPTPLLYWDDRNIDPTKYNLTGCLSVPPSTGCHTWPLAAPYGLQNVINTWWYASSTTATSPTVLFKRFFSSSTDSIVCQGDTVIWGGQPRVVSGTYNAIYQSITGCDSICTLNLTVKPAPLVNLGPNVSECNGQSHTFDAGLCNTCTYQWANLTLGQLNIGTSQTYTTSQAGTYMVTKTDTNGCSSRDTVVLMVGSTPSITNTIYDFTICSGSSTNLGLLSNVPGTVFHWIPSLVSGNITGMSIDSGTIINQTLINHLLTPGVVKYTVTPIDSGCAGIAKDFHFTVNPFDTVNISIATMTTTVCEGTLVTFNASTSNGGSNPVYQWKVNGIDQGINSPVFSYVPLNNDLVICILTSSNTTCILNNPATSNQVIMVVNPNMAVGVSIGAIPNPYCTGDQVTITATPDHGGLTPTYLWKVNDIAMTATGPVYTYTPVNGDQVRCYMTSSLQCTTNNPAMSNNIVLTENSNFPAGVNVTTTANPFCPGTSVTYTAWPSNGGTVPSYQWKVNGVNTGSNLPTYSYSPQPGDSIRCIMTSNLSCVTGSPASSAKVIMSALPVPAVTFTTCFDTITTLNAKPIKLKGGIPYGGTYSGPGVNSSTGVFTPSVAGAGTKTITYSYTNVAQCSAGKNKTITVQANPAFTCGNNLVDIRDNKSYPTVQIGTQCWMQTNLNFGTEISDAAHQTDNCIIEKYISHASPVTRHAFYQWDEVMRYDATPGLQGLCPPGWHVPDETEWNTLFTFYQGNARAGYPLQDQFLNGFKAMQNGVYYLNSMWSFTDFATLFWSSTMADQTRAYAHGMNTIDQSVSVYAGLKANGFSVRCLKD